MRAKRPKVDQKRICNFVHIPLIQPKIPLPSQEISKLVAGVFPIKIVFKHQTRFGISGTLFIPEVGRVLLVAYSHSGGGFDHLHHPRPDKHIFDETTGKISNEYRVDIC